MCPGSLLQNVHSGSFKCVVPFGAIIVPFIIEDAKKAFYYRGLSEWKNEKGRLMDTCLDGQDTFMRLLEMLDIK